MDKVVALRQHLDMRKAARGDDHLLGAVGALKAAAALLSDGALEKARADRYAGWEKPEAKALLTGSLEDAAAVVTSKGLNPEPKSGRQERLENLWNHYL